MLSIVCSDYGVSISSRGVCSVGPASKGWQESWMMQKSCYIDNSADLSHGANCQSTSMRVDPKHSKRSAQITPPSLTCVIEANSILPIHNFIHTLLDASPVDPTRQVGAAVFRVYQRRMGVGYVDLDIGPSFDRGRGRGPKYTIYVVSRLKDYCTDNGNRAAKSKPKVHY